MKDTKEIIDEFVKTKLQEYLEKKKKYALNEKEIYEDKTYTELRLEMKLLERMPLGNELKKNINPMITLLRGHYLKNYPEGSHESFRRIEYESIVLYHIRRFYFFLFNLYSAKKFVTIVTNKEKNLIKRIKLNEGLNIKKQLMLYDEFGKSVCKRFTKDNPMINNSSDKIVNYMGELIKNSIYMRYQKELIEYLEQINYLNETLRINFLTSKDKLKRNVLSEPELILYKEIIEEISKAQAIGHKPNIQRISNNVAVKHNIKTDLRKAFDAWKKRNIITFEDLLNESKSKYDNQFNQYRILDQGINKIPRSKR